MKDKLNLMPGDIIMVDDACGTIFNTKDNVKRERYEVWCVLADGEDRLVGWSATKPNDYFEGIIETMGGTNVGYKTPKHLHGLFPGEVDKVWGKTEPIGKDEA